jgi:hypothetical protein
MNNKQYSDARSASSELFSKQTNKLHPRNVDRRAEGCVLPDDALTLPAHLQISKQKSRHNARTEADA